MILGVNEGKVKNKNVVVISGPSGVGKGTIIQKLLEADASFKLAISACTRQPRKNEIDGETYYFLDQQEFKKKAESQDFLEWCEVHGNYYGTLKSEIDRLTDRGETCILEIDTQGARKIKKQLSDCLLIFLTPPTIKSLKERLVNRKTEDEATINRRLKRAEEELKEVHDYDYVVVNDNIESAFDDTLEIIHKYTRSNT